MRVSRIALVLLISGLPVHAGVPTPGPSSGGYFAAALAVASTPADESNAPSSLPPSTQIEDPLLSFTKDTRVWSLTGGAAYDSDHGTITLTQFSIDTYILDDLAIRLGASFGYANAKYVRNSFQGGPEIGFRWHFYNSKAFTTYIDGSSGVAFHQHPLTEKSLHFNFDLQVGVGATTPINEQTHLQGGVRLYHLSNARVRGKERNLGYDGPLFYIGLLRSF